MVRSIVWAFTAVACPHDSFIQEEVTEDGQHLDRRRRHQRDSGRGYLLDHQQSLLDESGKSDDLPINDKIGTQVLRGNLADEVAAFPSSRSSMVSRLESAGSASRLLHPRSGASIPWRRASPAGYRARITFCPANVADVEVDLVAPVFFHSFHCEQVWVFFESGTSR